MTDVDEQTGGFPATLDLSSADTSGNKMENGWKDALVAEITAIETQNEGGKLPLGTPGINVRFTIDGGPFNGKSVWNKYWFPPADYDKEKRAKLLGMFSRFLTAIGYSDEEVKSPNFDMATTMVDAIGRECRVNTKYVEEYNNNNVTGVKPRIAGSGSEGGLL